MGDCDARLIFGIRISWQCLKQHWPTTAADVTVWDWFDRVVKEADDELGFAICYTTPYDCPLEEDREFHLCYVPKEYTAGKVTVTDVFNWAHDSVRNKRWEACLARLGLEAQEPLLYAAP